MTKKALKKLLYVLLLLCVRQYCYAVVPDNIRQWSIGDGLSQSEVRTINRDSHGMMWFGTLDGLNRFDGYEFKKFVRNPFDESSLSNDIINTTFEDSNRDIWVGTNRGLNRFSFKKGNVERIKLTGARADYVFTIAESRNGNLLIGTHNDLIRVTKKGDQYLSASLLPKEPPSDPKSRVNYIGKSSSGGYWVCKASGLHKMNFNKNDEITGNRKYEFEDIKFKENRIRKCQEDARQNLWIVSGFQLFILKKGASVITKVNLPAGSFPERITTLLIDKYGLLWLGSTNEGVFRYKINKDGTPEKLDRIGAGSDRPNLSAKTILTLYESKEINDDDVWVGTSEAGVFQFSRSKNNYKHWHELLKNEPAYSKSIFSLCAARNGEVWAGTLEGLLRFNKDADGYKKFIADPKRPERNAFQSILEDRKGRLWLGSNEGLYQFDRAREAFKPFAIPTANGHMPMVMKVFEDKAGVIWVGTSDYLLKINTDDSFDIIQNVVFEGKMFKIGTVGDIEQESENAYWLGTSHGLYLFDGKKIIRAFVYKPDNPKGLMENIILDVFLSPKKEVWVATTKGLSKAEKVNGKIEFKHYTERNGLPNSFVYGILTDAGNNLWFSTNKGLAVLNPATGIIKNYQENDGLGGNEFNSGAFAKSSTGEMFFGGLNALVSFNPDKFIENNHIPKLSVSSLQLAEKEVNIDSLVYNRLALKIPYDENNVRLRLSSLDFTNPEKNEYAYRIRGIHDQWVSNGKQRQLSFFDLPYGEYILELKSSNNNNVWNDHDILTIPLHIVPPFWRTYLFYALMFLLVSVLIYLFYRNRLQSKLRFLVAMETVRLEENERVRKIASQDMHDEFGNSLTRISILTELIKAKINQKKDDDALSLLTKIADNSNRLYQGTKDFIWSINAENDNLFEVAIRIKDFCEEVLDNSGKTFDCEGISEKMREINLNPGASRHVVMIFKEAVMNTLKHSEATCVKLSFEIETDSVLICWEDNGKGFAGCENKGLGLTNMKNRADRIKSVLSLDSDKGTKVMLRAPFKQNK